MSSTDVTREAAPATGLAIFRRLSGAARPKRVPVVLQLNIVECGAAALTMALGYHGKHVSLHHVREQIGVDRDGATALSLLGAARGYGMTARGARLEIEDFAHLPVASILHWDFNHFVVFERFLGDAIEVVDPAVGRRRVPLTEARKSFTGVAILLEPSEAFVPQARAAAPSWRYVRAALSEGAMWTRIAVTSLVIQLCAIAIPLMTGMVVDRVVPRDDVHLLTVASCGFASIVVFNFLAAMSRAHLLLQLRTQLDVKMALGFLTHLVGLPFDFFQKRSAGDILMRLGSNTAIRDILTTGALSAMIDGALVCLYLGLLLLASPLMGAVALGLGALQLGTFWVCGKKRRELMAENLHVQARQANYQVEILAGIEALKSMGAEQRAVEHWTDLFVDSQNVALQRGRLSAALDSTMSSLRLAAPLVVLGTGATLVLSGQMGLGMMLALNALALGFLTPLATLVGTAEQLELLGSYVQRLDDVFGHSLEQDAARVAPPPKLTGRMRVESVSFRYGDRAPLAVRDVSVDIEPGQCVAIVGPSGCGKTTLASLLLALYKPTSGRILFDGRDLAGLDVVRLRHQLGVVIQRPYVFGATVRQNIALADPGVSLETVRRAAALAQIDEEIMALPMGYETIVNGSTLSGGQRQRISIARALLHEPSILLMDEATSSLDSITEARVREAIDALGCTRIVLAHRLSTIRHADVILVMKDGAIVERGTHDQLLALGGNYCELIAAQRDAG